MKRIFVTLLLASATTVAFAQGQGELTTTTTTTKTTTVQQPAAPLAPSRRPAAAPLSPSEGVVQAAVRTRSPAPMINPFAPGHFGSGQQHVTHDPKDPGKPKGIALFAWTF